MAIEILSQRHADEIRLRPLTIDETGIATTLILGGELPRPRDVVEAVHERTNGIPLHMKSCSPRRRRGRADGRRIREAHVPDTIGDAVLVRLERRSPEAREVVRAGAVIGRCFRPDVLAGVMDRPMAEPDPPLQSCEQAAILYPSSMSTAATTTSATSCCATRSTTHSRQLLRRFHAHAAEFVMTLEASSVVHASRHYEEAGSRREAYRLPP